MKFTTGAAALLAVCLGLALPAHSQAGQPQVAAAHAQTPTLGAAQWQADLDFFVSGLKKRHKNAFHTVDEASFDKAVADLRGRIPELERHQIIVGMMRLAAMIGDGHTNISPLKDAAFRLPSVPVKFYDFDDGVYVWAAAPGYEHLLGAKLTAVGGVALERVRNELKAISARDNQSGARFYLPIFLAMPGILHGMSLTDEATATTYSFVDAEGNAIDARLPASHVEPMWPPDTDVSLIAPQGWTTSTASGSTGLPLWLRDPLNLHRLVPMQDRDALYVQLNMVTDIDGQSMAALGKRIEQYTNHWNPKVVVIDLRLNRGGNHDLRFPFIASLIRVEDADTALYVLVGRGSFSATQAIIDDLRDYTDATLVGEPASSKPNSYSDSYRDAMPHSGLAFRTSIKWNQTDQSTRPWTAIDEAAPPRFAEYSAGEDGALEFALAAGGSKNLKAELLARAAKGDLESLAQSARDYMRSPRVQYQDIEEQLLLAAVGLNRAGYAAPAREIAELAISYAPSSTDAWTVLALLSKAGGKLERAREAAQQAVLLDPNNRSVRSVLQ